MIKKSSCYQKRETNFQNQPLSQKIIFNIFTILFWGVFLYFWNPIILLVGWYIGIREILGYKVEKSDFYYVNYFLLGYLSFIVFLVFIISGWVKYNLLKKQRRKSIHTTTNSDKNIDSFHGISKIAIMKLKMSRSIVIHHNEKGRIILIKRRLPGA